MTENMHLDEHHVRLQKLSQLKKAGVIPYANKFDKKQSAKELTILGEDVGNLQNIDHLMEQGATPKYSTAGRLMMFRSHGKLSFGTIRDDTSDIQISFVRGTCCFNTGKEIVDTISIAGSEVSSYKFVEKFFDIGDFIGVKGDLFVTKHGELTLFVNEYQMLSKALRPLGDKWHGIKDEEKIYRQRYLDMTMNQSSYDRFIFKSKFYKALRNFYDSQGFHEIVTSVLGNAASGAAAKPFKTHHNDFDLEVFLRIAFEPALKMATVGRYEKVYEIGKDFRNEGSDPSHLQEFTQVEHYAAYWNYEDNMRFAEAMFDYLFNVLELDTVISIKDKEGNSRDVDRSTPRQRIDYIQGVKQASGGLDITNYGMEDEAQLRADIKALGHERVGMDQQGVTTMIDYLYKKVLRPSIIGPAFVYNYPKTMQPLARGSDEDPNIVEQFQVVVNGREIIKAYSELVDPTVQEANFEEQGKALEKGDEEATSGDDDFMLAMEHGMPCQSGFGMGLERILALLTGQDNLRDVVMFPLMKPIQENGEIKVQSEDTVDSNKLENSFEGNISINTQKVHSLIESYLTDTKLHCQQVGYVMKAFARQLGEDEQLRHTVGLLHDIDRDHIGKVASDHLGEEFDTIMDQLDADEHLRRAIKSHYPDGTGIHPENLLEKYLISVDELTGFLYAYARMRPEGYNGIQWKSINKKMKDKAFASGVDRDHLRNCEKYLGIPLSEFALSVSSLCNHQNFPTL